MRTCAKCGETRPLDQFGRQSSAKDGIRPQCKPCVAVWRQAYIDRIGYDNYRQMIRNAPSAQPEYKKAFTRNARLKKQYGMTQADFEMRVEEQMGRCLICLEVPEKPLVIDHDHDTSKVRGLLCFVCNSALGHVEKPGWIASALSYLALHSPEKIRVDA